MASKEIRQLVRELERQGWAVSSTRTNHLRAWPPDGGQPVMLPSTPSDHRALANSVARLRRQGFVWKGR